MLQQSQGEPSKPPRLPCPLPCITPPPDLEARRPRVMQVKEGSSQTSPPFLPLACGGGATASAGEGSHEPHTDAGLIRTRLPPQWVLAKRGMPKLLTQTPLLESETLHAGVYRRIYTHPCTHKDTHVDTNTYNSTMLWDRVQKRAVRGRVVEEGREERETFLTYGISIWSMHCAVLFMVCIPVFSTDVWSMHILFPFFRWGKWS